MKIEIVDWSMFIITTLGAFGGWAVVVAAMTHYLADIFAKCTLQREAAKFSASVARMEPAPPTVEPAPNVRGRNPGWMGLPMRRFRGPCHIPRIPPGNVHGLANRHRAGCIRATVLAVSMQMQSDEHPGFPCSRE